MAALQIKPGGHRQQPEAQGADGFPQTPPVPAEGPGKGKIASQNPQGSQGDGQVAGTVAELQEQPQQGRRPQAGIGQALGPPEKVRPPGRIAPGAGGKALPGGEGGQDQSRHSQGAGQQHPGAQGISRNPGEQAAGPERQAAGHQHWQGRQPLSSDGSTPGSHFR